MLNRILDVPLLSSLANDNKELQQKLTIIKN